MYIKGELATKCRQMLREKRRKNGSSLRLTLVVGCQSYSLIWLDHPTSRFVFAVWILLVSSYFDYAAINSEEINISNIRYTEFSHIAEDMNKMVIAKKKAETLRSTSEKRLQLQREQSSLGYIEYNLDYNIVYWNSSAERIFGYSKEKSCANFKFNKMHRSIKWQKKGTGNRK